MSFYFILGYLGIGTIVGVLAGLLGVGGGLIMVPALIWLFTLQGFQTEYIPHIAIACSLTSIVFTALSSIKTHQAYHAIDWSIVKKMTIGFLLGSLCGAQLASLMNAKWLILSFALFVIFSGLNLLFKQTSPDLKSKKTTRSQTIIVGFFIAIISSLVGIGGGSLTVPWLLHQHISIRHAVATSAACGFPIALFACLGFIFFGWNKILLPLSSGFVYWPAVFFISFASIITAPYGAKMAHQINQIWLKRFFALFMILVGLKLLWSQQ